MRDGMQGSKRYIIIHIDNLVFDLANYYLDLIDLVNETLVSNFGINKREFTDLLITHLKSSTKPTEDIISIAYQILQNSYNKKLEFPSTQSKNYFCNSIKVKFNNAKKSILKLLPNSIQVLDFLKSEYFVIIGITNLSSTLARTDLKLLGIDKYFDTVYTYEDSIKFHKKNSTDLHNIWINSTLNTTSSTSCDIIELPPNIYKPSRRIVEKILNDFDFKPLDAIMISRNMEQDLLPAKLLGIKTVLIDTQIKIKNRSNLRILLQNLGSKHLRTLLNLYNNKLISHEVKPGLELKSMQYLTYALTNK